MTLRLRTTLVAFALAALAVPAAAAGARTSLVEIDGARFPDRAFVLTLPAGRVLTPDSLEVTENGRPVSGVTAVPASTLENKTFGVVLVIDASNSMRGEAIAGAIEAARTFAEHRSANQRIAVVTFNSNADVVLPFSGDDSAIDAALAAPPPLQRQTRMYDAVHAAIRLIDTSDVSSGSIVLLSDGADTASVASAAEIASASKENGIRVFSVGLVGTGFDAKALRELAAETGGAYAEATTPKQLSAIYDALGAQLAREYVVRYRSLAGPDEAVDVAVRVAGVEGVATSGYRTPPLPTFDAPPVGAPPSASFWRGTVAMISVAAASAALLVLAFAVVVARRRPRLADRMSAFVSLPVEARAGARGSAFRDTVLAGPEKSLGRSRWWSRFSEEVELARIRWSPAQIAAATAGATLLMAIVLIAVAGPFYMPLALLPVLVGRSFVKRKLAKQRKIFAEQLPDNLQVLGSALRAGHSFVGALSVVVDDAAEPSRSEFQRAVADERLGVPLEETLAVVGRRMASRDVDQVALVAALQRLSGGNSAEVLDRVAETVRERGQLRRLVQSLTAQGRMARWIVSLLPLALLLVLTVLNREYMEPLYTESIGRVVLIVSGIMVTAGSLIIKRIVDIKV